jgi:hypothetical protein
MKGADMERKRSTMRKQGSSLALQRETLRQLADSELQGAAGGARLWKPFGLDENTEPIFGNEDES